MHIILLACIVCIGHVTANITDTDPSAKCPPFAIDPTIQSISCYEYQNIFDCSKPVPVGSRVLITCSKYHYAGKQEFTSAYCSRNGIWSTYETCKIPVCGQQGNSTRHYASWGQSGIVEAVNDAELPWNIVIYRKFYSWTYNCVGTLISPKHVISTAYCVMGESSFDIPASNFLLAAHKLNYKYDFDTSDRSEQWRYVASIARHALYDRHDGANNLAILVATTRFWFRSYLMPACIDWSGELPPPTASDVLVAAAMRHGTNDTSLELVAPQRYSIIYDRDSCISSTNASRLQFLSEDKTCAVSVGNETCDDRHGAGLTQRHATPVGDRYYLWEVGRARLYSTQTDDGCFTNIGSGFTNLTQNLWWITMNMT